MASPCCSNSHAPLAVPPPPFESTYHKLDNGQLIRRKLETFETFFKQAQRFGWIYPMDEGADGDEKVRR